MRFVVIPFLCGAVSLTPLVVRAQETPPEQPVPVAPVAPVAPVPSAAPPAPSPAEAREPEVVQPLNTKEAAPNEAKNEAAKEGEAGKGDEEKPPIVGTCDDDPKPRICFSGSIEAAYSYNFNQPSNGVTAFRWYDFRHNVIGIQNALLTTGWNLGPTEGHVALQLANFNELFWDAGRGPEQDLLWRLLQEVVAKWTTPYERLSIEGGSFNVPFGPEYNVAYLNWSWSAGNMFALMPYQIGGFRANFDIGNGWTARLGVYNGWDQIVTDNNNAKSVMASLEWENPDDDETYFYLNYMIGNERDRGDTRGPYARHTFDVYGQWHAVEKLFLRGHVFSGFEPTRGSTTDGWFGASAATKVDLTPWFSIAARGDVVKTFSGDSGENIFHADSLAAAGRPTSDSTLLGSATLTLDVHTADFASVRLEARHDRADFPLFFGGNVQKDATSGEDIATKSNQTTVTAGLTTWF